MNSKQTRQQRRKQAEQVVSERTRPKDTKVNAERIVKDLLKRKADTPRNDSP